MIRVKAVMTITSPTGDEETVEWDANSTRSLEWSQRYMVASDLVNVACRTARSFLAVARTTDPMFHQPTKREDTT